MYCYSLYVKKDFRNWSKNKEEINSKEENKFYHSREVWWCALGLNIGFEQDGSGGSFVRPVLILKGFNKHVCLIIPLTTSNKINKYHICIGEIDKRESYLIMSQIRLIDTKRLINKICTLDKAKFENIRKIARGLI